MVDFLGGRKMFLVILGIVLTCVNKFAGLELPDENIIWLTLGGAGAVAAEDGLKGLGKGDSKAKGSKK